MLSDAHYDFPTASKERLEALAFKRMRFEKHQELVDRVSPELNDPNLTHSPDMAKTLKIIKSRFYKHTGKWEKKEYED